MSLNFTGSTPLWIVLFFAAGLICIIKGGDLFVDAASWIAEASGIPKFIIGPSSALPLPCRKCWCPSLRRWKAVRISP